MQLTKRCAIVLVVASACSDSTPQVDASPADATTDTGFDAAPDGGIEPPGICDAETRDDDYTPGMSRIGANGYTVILVDSSPPPGSSGNYTWQVRVLDPAQAPRDQLDLRVFPAMPDHGHGTSPATVAPSGGGIYTISAINLFMTGYWTIRLGLRENEAELDFVLYKFCVD